MNSGQSAKSIAEYLLDQTGRGLLTGNFKLFAPYFMLPQDIETFDGRRHLASLDDVRAVFDCVRAHHEKMGVTDLVRHVVVADYRDPNTISTVHQSRLVNNATLVQKPFNVFSVLRKMDGRWRSAQSQYAVDDSPSLCRALVGALPAT